MLVQKKAAEVFGFAIDRELIKSPLTVELLETYAKEYNASLSAKVLWINAKLNLDTDETTILKIQKALNAVASGGQSDMNLELGSMRLKLIQASNRIAGDKAAVITGTSELALAITNLMGATLTANADPIASDAIDAVMVIEGTSTPSKRLQEDPLAWNWILK